MAFQDSTLDPCHVVLQFFGKQEQSRESIQEGVFFVIVQDTQFRLERFPFVRDYGIFWLQ